MEEILLLDKQITFMKSTIENVLSFSVSQQQPQNQLDFLLDNLHLKKQFENLFIEKFKQYIKLHLLPELHKKIQLCKSDKQKQVNTFVLINKGIYKMQNHIESRFQNLDKTDEQQMFNDLKTQLQQVIVFDIYEKLEFKELIESFFEALFHIYKQSLQQNIKKDQHQPSSVQNQFILYQIEQVLPLYNFQLQNDAIQNFKLVLNYLINLYRNYQNFFLHNQYQFLNTLSYLYIKNIFNDLSKIIQQEKKFQQEFEGYYQLLIKDYLKWIFIHLDLSVSPNDLLFKEFLQVMKSSLNRILQQELSPHLFNIMLHCSEEKQFLEFVAFNIQNSEVAESMIQNLKQNVQDQLLKISISTKTIIKFYLTLLRFWSEMKNSFTALQDIAKLIKKYFLKRENALRCIIQLWIEEIKEQRQQTIENTEEESQVFNVPVADERDLASNEDIMSSEQQIEIMVQKSKKTTNNKVKFKKSNVKTLLIDLYGSRDSFLEEYEIFMAEKILYFKTINLQEEKDSFAFLKKNLKNSQNLSRFNVLLYDLNDSEQLVENFCKEKPKYKAHKFLVLSKSFWPINHDLQDINQEIIDKYLPAISEFQNFYLQQTNNHKKILMHNCIGNTELEIELNKQKIEVVCSTLHTLLLMIIQENKQIELRELENKIGINQDIIRQKMQFWVSKQIILEIKNQQLNQSDTIEFNRQLTQQSNQCVIEEASEDIITYKINNNYNANEGLITNKNDKNEWILQSKELGKHSQNELQKQKIENLILQILKTSGAKTTDKIYELLKTIYKSDIPALFDKSFLKKSLERMMKSRRINQQGDVYYYQTVQISYQKLYVKKNYKILIQILIMTTTMN